MEYSDANDQIQPKHMSTSKFGFRSLGVYLGLGAVMSLSLLMTVSLLFVREQSTLSSQAREVYIESTGMPGPSTTPTPSPMNGYPTSYPEPTTAFAECGSYKLGSNGWGDESCRNELRVWCYNPEPPEVPFQYADWCYKVTSPDRPDYVHCAFTACHTDETARKIVNQICCPQLINVTDTPIYTPAPPGRGWPQ